MKKSLVLFALLLATWTGHAAESLPLFNAVLTVGSEHRFVLVSGGKTSSFLRPGQAFEAYTIGAYDAKEGKLTVTRDGRPHVLALVSGAATGEAPMATVATVNDAQAVLAAMNFEDMMDKTMAGVRRQQASGVEQMTKQMVPSGGSAETRNEIAAFQKKLIEEMMSGVTGAALKDDVAKAYAEVFTREELQALGAFYQTPTGKMFSEKQAELSEKMNGIVMTKMMTMSPKTQQMMQEFSAQMRAKRAAAKAGPPAPAPSPAAPKQ
jgi:hypothetical protein